MSEFNVEKQAEFLTTINQSKLFTMSTQKKTNIPLLISIIAFALGMVVGALGMIKADCIGPNCWVGSGFLKWTGGLMIVGGLIGMAAIGGKTKRS